MEQIQQHEWEKVPNTQRFSECKYCDALYDSLTELYFKRNGSELTEEPACIARKKPEHGDS